MLGNALKPSLILATVAMLCCAAAAAAAEPGRSPYDPCQDTHLDAISGFGPISKVKPAAPTTAKVKPLSGWGTRAEGFSSINPATWGPECCLPVLAKGQFLIGPRVWFARLGGEARRGFEVTGIETSAVQFDDHLGLSRSGFPIWTLEALYQFRPRWGIRYAFTPFKVDATHSPRTAFNFMGQTFVGGTDVRSAWERFEHRAGLVFNISHTMNSSTNLFAEWLYVRDKLSIGTAAGTTPAVTWDDNKHMAVIGLEFDKCLKNYHGNTLSLSGRAGIAFLGDNLGYEGEAALSYLIPIRTGRFGFVKGGYRYAHLKKERPRSMFSSTIDGAFVQFGFLF